MVELDKQLFLVVVVDIDLVVVDIDLVVVDHMELNLVVVDHMELSLVVVVVLPLLEIVSNILVGLKLVRLALVEDLVELLVRLVYSKQEQPLSNLLSLVRSTEPCYRIFEYQFGRERICCHL